MNTRKYNAQLYETLLSSDDIILCFITPELQIFSASNGFKKLFLHKNPLSENTKPTLETLFDFGRKNKAFFTELINYFAHATPTSIKVLHTATEAFEIRLSDKFLHEETPMSALFLNRKSDYETGNISEEINPLLQEYIELAGDGVVLGNEKGEIIHINQVMVEFTGFSKSEIIGKHIRYIFEDDELEKKPLRFQDLDKGAEILTERWLRRRKGNGIPVEMHSRRTSDGYISIMRNISQRLESQKQLKDMHDRLLFVTKMEAIGIIEVDMSNGHVSINNNMLDILQKDRVEVKNSLNFWLQSIHPDDVDRVKEGIDMVVETGQLMDLIYRIKHNDHKESTIKSSANILRGLAEDVNRLIISSVDISSSINLKNQIREQMNTFKALTESTSAAIFIYSDKYLFVNQAFERITGYNQTSLKNLPFWQIVHPDHRELVKKRGIRRITGDSTIPNYEFKILTKTNQTKWLEFSANHTLYMGQKAAIGTAFDITDRKNMELKLMQNIVQIEDEKQKSLEIESQFRVYMEQNTAPMLALDVATKSFVFSNEAARKMYGYSTEEFLNLTAYDIQTLTKDDVDMKMKQALENFAYNYEFVHKKKNGERISVDVHVSKVVHNQMITFVLIIHDKTEELRNKSQLKQSHDTYQNILNSISEMIYILNLNGEFIFVNQAAIEKYGYSADEFVGSTPEFVSAPGKNNSDQVAKAIKKAFDGQQNTLYFWGLKKDGSIFPKEVVLSPGFYFGERVIIAVSRDISEQIKITNELIEARDKAEESDRLKSAFLANMSHEIRTPMNAILGFSELILDPHMETDEKVGFLKIINRSSYHLLNLINDLVDISKINANQMKISVNIFSLNGLLMELVHYFNGELINMHKQDKVLLSYSFGLSVGNDMMSSDETRLRQILHNVIENAVKFTRKGEVIISYELNDGQLHFTISDTGIGITGLQKQIIFDRFTQADSSISQEFGGTGLGLAIAKSCVGLLGGEIWAESEHGIGTRMQFTIPFNTLPTEN